MDSAYGFILFFGGSEFLILLSVLGIYFGERRIFLNTLLIAFCGIAINAYMKSIFQVPLNPEIGKLGWAYPSGHSMFDVIFWGALFIQVRKPWVLMLGLAITIPNFFGMVHKRYHNWEDILGGVCSGGLVLIAFYYWVRYKVAKITVFAVATLVINLFIYFCLLPLELLGYKWLQLIIGSQIGICLAVTYIEKLMPKRLYAKVAAFFIAIACVYLMHSFLRAGEAIDGLATSLCFLMLVPGVVKYIESKVSWPLKYARTAKCRSV